MFHPLAGNQLARGLCLFLTNKDTFLYRVPYQCLDISSFNSRLNKSIKVYIKSTSIKISCLLLYNNYYYLVAINIIPIYVFVLWCLLYVYSLYTNIFVGKPQYDQSYHMHIVLQGIHCQTFKAF